MAADWLHDGGDHPRWYLADGGFYCADCGIGPAPSLGSVTLVDRPANQQ